MTENPAAFVLCGTPRAGSTLLCGMLAQTGVTGAPDSFFRRQSLDDWAQDWGLPAGSATAGAAGARRYLDAALREGRGSSRIFGLRLMQENLHDAMQIIGSLYPGLASDHARFQAAFGPTVYVHLSRSDTLAQAVSRVRAEQSGLWHVAPDGSEIERTAPPREPHYDRAAIAHRLAELERHDRNWLDWFAAEGIAPLSLRYEAIARDPHAALAQVLEHIRQDPALATRAKPGVRKLADATTAEWISRYRLGR